MMMTMLLRRIFSGGFTVSSLLFSFSSIRSCCHRVAFHCVISNDNYVLARRRWEVDLFQTDNDGVVHCPVCISVNRFLARRRWELISVDRFWRDIGGSCSPSTVFGTTQVGFIITTDDNRVIRRPVCALVACWGP